MGWREVVIKHHQAGGQRLYRRGQFLHFAFANQRLGAGFGQLLRNGPHHLSPRSLHQGRDFTKRIFGVTPTSRQTDMDQNGPLGRDLHRVSQRFVVGQSGLQSGV